MGIGGISIWQLLIVLAIVVMIFGTRRFKTLGTDVGGAIKGFKSAMSDDEAKKSRVILGGLMMACPPNFADSRKVTWQITNVQNPLRKNCTVKG